MHHIENFFRSILILPSYLHIFLPIGLFPVDLPVRNFNSTPTNFCISLLILSLSIVFHLPNPVLINFPLCFQSRSSRIIPSFIYLMETILIRYHDNHSSDIQLIITLYIKMNWLFCVSLKLENDWADFANFCFEMFMEV